MKKILTLILVGIMILGVPVTVWAEESFEESMIRLHRLSEASVEFLHEHHVDFEVFRDATVYPEDHPIQYNSSIESLIMQTGAYGFSDEQVQMMVKGTINSKPTIIGGKYDNTGRIRITIPAYPVSLNGKSIDYTDSVYPIISYKDMPYFPMTWDYARVLGVTTAWSHEDGFRVKAENATAEIPVYGSGFNEQEYLYAENPNYPIYINGEKIENANREYPIVNFRNITYFPVTEEIAEKLEWEYSFDEEQGLSLKKVENIVLYRGYPIDVTSSFENIQGELSEEEYSRADFERAFYNYENEEFIGKTIGIVEPSIYEGCFKVLNVHKIAVSKEYNPIPREVNDSGISELLEKVPELQEYLNDENKEINVVTADLEGNGTTEYIVCLRDKEAVDSTVILYNETGEKVETLIYIRKAYWARMEEEYNKRFIENDGIEVFDIDSDGIMEVLVETPAYHDCMLGIFKYDGEKVVGESNIDATIYLKN